MFCWPQVSLVQPPPQTPAMPPPPQVCGSTQLPQLSCPPQPSPAGPQLYPSCTQVFGVQVGRSGATHAPKSNSMNSRTLSCGVIGVAAPHSPGKVVPPVPPVLTWKSLKSTRPHWLVGAAPTGVLKVYSSGV